MEILNYSKDKMGEDIVQLFKEIYPNEPMEHIMRAAYDEGSPLHVVTKVAIVDDRIVGQANIFYLQHNKTMANIGFHVHPKYQRQGIGRTLASKAMKEAKEKGIRIIVVQTERDNSAGVQLAEALGFSEVSKVFIDENANGLKLCRLKNGIVLKKEI